MLVKNLAPASGTANGVTAGNAVNLPSIGLARGKPGTLALDVTVDAETNLLTFTVQWQGSDAAAFSSPVDLSLNSQNGAGTVLATGTGGADTPVTRSVPAPDSAYGYRYVRARLVVAGATGTTNDTYVSSYRMRT